MKIPWKGEIVVVLGNVEIQVSIYGLEEGGSEFQMNDFEFVNMTDYGLKDERYTSDLVPYCSHEVIAMMKNMGYMPSKGFGKEGKRVVEFPNFKTQSTKECLGFFEDYDGIKKNLGTFNGNFFKEGGEIPFCGFLELWVGKDGKVYPSWEIFFNEKLTFKEKPTVVIKKVQEEVNWVDYMDAEAMETMLKMEGDMFTITNEEPSDLSTLIVPAVAQLNN